MISFDVVQFDANNTHIHSNRDDHKFSIEAHQGCVFFEAVLFDESDLDGSKKVPVQSSVDDENDHLRYLIPNIVDVNIATQVSDKIKYMLMDLEKHTADLLEGWYGMESKCRILRC